MTSEDARAAYAVAVMARQPLLPYQLDAIDATSTPNLAGTGYAHPVAVWVMPRQVGKTTSIFRMLLGRMQVRHDYRCATTAQTGHTVTERFSDPGGWFDQVTTSPLAGAHHLRRSQGTERITNTRTGSFLKAFPPRPGKLRSNALDAVVLDECQEHTPELGAALDSDVGPVFLTRPRRQLILAGTASGPGWWRDKYESARAGELLLVEVGTWPEDADPADPATWRAHHPGLIHGLTDEDYLAKQLAILGVDTFAREYGNRWTVGRVDPAIPDKLWAPAAVTAPPVAPAAIGFHVERDGAHAAIVAVGRAGARLVAGVVAYRPGTTWLPDELARLRDTHRVPIVADYVSPAGPVVDILRRRRVPVRCPTPGEYVTACGLLWTLLEHGEAGYLPHPALEDARNGAARRMTERGGWVWSAARSTADPSPLIAWTVALWAARMPENRPHVVTSNR